jgi:hypothetical protein
MANLWENIKRKLDQGAPKAQSADWEAMSQKIGAYPQLAPKAVKPWWLVAAAVVVPVALFILAFNFWPNSTKNAKPSKLNQPKIETTAPAALPHGDDSILTKSISGTTPAEAELETPIPTSKSTKEDLSSTVPQMSNSKNTPIKSSVTALPKVANTTTLNKGEKRAATPKLPKKTTTLPSLNGESETAEESLDLENNNAPSESTVSQLPSNANNPKVAADKAANNLANAATNEGEGELSNDTKPVVTPKLPVAKTATTKSDAARVTSAEAKNKAEQKTTANDSVENEITTAASPEKNDFYKPELGLKLQSLDFGGLVLSPLIQPQAWAAAGGITVNLERQKFRLSAGLFVGQSWVNTEFTTTSAFKQIDSSLVTRFETREEIRVTTVWVIDSFFSGRYVSDTTRVMVTDTIVETVFDTTDVTANNLNTRTVQISFAEIPLVAGYEWQRGNWGFQLKAGAVLNQVTLRENIGPISEGETTTDFGLDAVIQPGISYRLGTNFGLYSRWGVRQSLVQNAFLGSATTHYTWQFGLSYYFR